MISHANVRRAPALRQEYGVLNGHSHVNALSTVDQRLDKPGLCTSVSVCVCSTNESWNKIHFDHGVNTGISVTAKGMTPIITTPTDAWRTHTLLVIPFVQTFT